MSFNNEISKVKDDSLPIGNRYISLRSALELHCPFGFKRTWKILEQKFGIIEGETNDPDSLVRSAEFLEKDRDLWLHVMDSQSNLARFRASHGLPKPEFSCDHK
jgi:hypothetical protein